MPYQAEISRLNPTCFLLLVDQSGSMAEPFGAGSDRSKAQGVAEAVNRLLQALVARCAKGEQILDRYYVGVIGYGGVLLPGFPVPALAGDVLQRISRIGAHPLRVEERLEQVDDGRGGLRQRRIKFPVWFPPEAQGKTPMCAALRMARDVLGTFVQGYPHCFPPVVINISDGRATDGNFGPDAQALTNLVSTDGNVLLFNIQISSHGEPPLLFPSTDQCLPDDYARRLFHASSRLPPSMLQQAVGLQTVLPEGARGFAFNADLAAVVMFLDVGTRVSVGYPPAAL